MQLSYYELLPYRNDETIILYCHIVNYINIKNNEGNRIIVPVLSFQAPRNYKKELLFPCAADYNITKQLRVVADSVEYFLNFIINRTCIIL